MLGDVFSTLDLIIFFVALIGVMAVGFFVGKREESSEDYFLAGRQIPWFGVAGSIFGSNVSANHMVGMMGIGFSIGFAQSHFELGAILGLMVLCYGFLPVYRKLQVYTLSEYLGRRYDERSRIAYAIIMVIIMAVVQMVPGLYIGARSICVLMGGNALEQVEASAEPAADGAEAGEEKVVDDEPPQSKRMNVNFSYYVTFVIALALISAGYTILGGLKAVVWTDVIQSVLLLIAGIAVAILTFNEVGGWSGMLALDAAQPVEDQKMHLYLPMDHSQLPWTGVFTGLMMMHCFYWGTNQFIVQRALGARSDSEARLGIITAGFLKLLIPFFAIGAGIASVYVFKQRLPDQTIDPDAAFSELVKLVIPLKTGIIGLIAAGLIGAILSSIDSMMNSAATIVTMDVYKRHINPNATDKQMIFVGRLSIVAFMLLAAWMAIFVLDPNSTENFFLQIANYQNYLTPGLLVAFAMGMFWKRGTATGAFVTINAGILFSYIAVRFYNGYLISEVDGERFTNPRIAEYIDIAAYLGTKLNFFHRVVFVIGLCAVVHVFVSLMTRPDEEKSRLVWTDLGGHAPGAFRALMIKIAVSIGVFAVLGLLMTGKMLSPAICAFLGLIWTFAMFCHGAWTRLQQNDPEAPITGLMKEDRFWAGILCGLAVFMHYYFY
ncbi:MAG: hypothetical protein CMJ78_02735 [Planctomycetaceae bacterium]|nr:hypothetical protein [Planctomycetaceae bacterium]